MNLLLPVPNFSVVYLPEKHMGLNEAKRGKKRPKNRSNKVHLVFDEDKRKEFLTGFRKRKLQRKKEAQEKLELEFKEERKRLKLEAKESYKKLVQTSKGIPELEHLLEEEYDDEDVTVKVVELSTNEIARKNNWIGANQPKYEVKEEEPSDNEQQSDPEEIPGMELKNKCKKAAPKQPTKKFDSEKDLKKELKRQATKNVKKSKVFQKKNKLEKQKQIKKSRQLKSQRMNIREKMGKNKRAKSKGKGQKSNQEGR